MQFMRILFLLIMFKPVFLEGVNDNSEADM